MGLYDFLELSYLVYLVQQIRQTAYKLIEMAGSSFHTKSMGKIIADSAKMHHTCTPPPPPLFSDNYRDCHVITILLTYDFQCCIEFHLPSLSPSPILVSSSRSSNSI